MANVSGVEWVKALAAGERVHANLCAAELVERSLKRGEGQLAANGTLVSVTGARTGRSPKDKFTVDDAVTHELVDWGKVNKPFAPEKFGPVGGQRSAGLGDRGANGPDSQEQVHRGRSGDARAGELALGTP